VTQHRMRCTQYDNSHYIIAKLRHWQQVLTEQLFRWVISAHECVCPAKSNCIWVLLQL